MSAADEMLCLIRRETAERQAWRNQFMAEVDAMLVERQAGEQAATDALHDILNEGRVRD